MCVCVCVRAHACWVAWVLKCSQTNLEQRPPHFPTFLEFPSNPESPGRPVWPTAPGTGRPGGQKAGSLPLFLPFHFLPPRTSQISSQGHDRAGTLRSDLRSDLPSPEQGQQPGPPVPCTCPSGGAGGRLDKVETLCLIMEQALGNGAAPGRACSVSGTLANEIALSRLTEAGSVIYGGLIAVQAIAF